MKKLNIGIDIDEVIAESVDTFLPYLNKKFNKNFSKNDLIKYRFEDSFNITAEDIIKFWRYFTDINGWYKIKPNNNAKNYINKWYNNHNIIVVTSRPREFLDNITKDWLENNEIEFHQLVFAHSKSKVDDLYNLGLKIDILIEDYWEFAIDAAKKDVRVFLADKPWNQSDNMPDNIHRFHDFKEIDTYINTNP